MMAVLIDMDLPERCYDCRFSILSNDVFGRARMKCILSGWEDNAVNVYKAKQRHKKCKLIHVDNNVNIARFVMGFGFKGSGK